MFSFVTQRYKSISEFPEYLYEIAVFMKIKDIIREEYQELLKEGYVMEHDNFKFKQKVENPSFFNYQAFSNDYDVDISESEIYMSWRIGFWLNEMGIENFLIQVDGVEGTYNVKLYDKRTDEEAQNTDRDIAEIPWRFNVSEASLQKGGGLYIQDATFDFETKNCDVDFTPSEY